MPPIIAPFSPEFTEWSTASLRITSMISDEFVFVAEVIIIDIKIIIVTVRNFYSFLPADLPRR
jgi:hypothetical protein